MGIENLADKSVCVAVGSLRLLWGNSKELQRLFPEMATANTVKAVFNEAETLFSCDGSVFYDVWASLSPFGGLYFTADESVLLEADIFVSGIVEAIDCREMPSVVPLLVRLL
jgi:hypothetical protein